MNKKLLFLTAVTMLSVQTLQAQLTSLNVGDNAPDFTVTDLHGHQHSLSGYAGKYVILDLFAYWCGPCQQAAPQINQFYKKYGCNSGNIIVLALDADGTEAQTQNFEDNYGGDSNFPTPTVSGQVGGASDVVNTYSPAAYPTIILIDNQGKIASEDIWPLSVSALETAVTSAGGSSALVEQECSTSSIVETINIKTIVYPNPTSSTISVLSNTTGEATLSLIDMTGRNVYSSTSNGKINTSIDVSKFEAGNYILTITSEKSIETQKVIIK